jgi:hypothetical protein
MEDVRIDPASTTDGDVFGAAMRQIRWQIRGER